MKTKDHYIDFSKIDWTKVDMEKAKFLFQEAQNDNNKIIEDITNMEKKAFRLISVVILILCAAIGVLFLQGKDVIIESLVFVSFILGSGLIFFIAAVYPGKIFKGKALLDQFFEGGDYKEDVHKIYIRGIITYIKHINYNRKVLTVRTDLMRVGFALFVTILVIVVVVLGIRYIGFPPKSV
ncbi:MAG: hypothetical protein LBI28_00215 [Treponema sp.]|nr:hypothetical protein [Treponema sp.]